MTSIEPFSKAAKTVLPSGEKTVLKHCPSPLVSRWALKREKNNEYRMEHWAKTSDPKYFATELQRVYHTIFQEDS